MIPPPAPPSSARRKITTSSEITYPPRANLPWAGFVGNRLPAGQTDEGRDAVSFLSVGAAACPDALEFHTQKRQSVSLPCVGGGGPRLRGSEGVYGSNFVGDYRTIASSKPIAFTPSVATNVATAPPTQGSLFLCPGGLFRRFLPLNIRYLAGEACLAPTVPCRDISPSLPCPTGGFALFLKKSPSATGKIPWPTASKRKR